VIRCSSATGNHRSWQPALPAPQVTGECSQVA
jgi:hypothetical protein